MPEITECPECHRKLNVHEEQLGQTVQCPVCGTSFTAAVVSVQRPPLRPPPMPEEREPPPRPRYDDYDRGRGGYPPPRRYGRGPDPYADPLPHRGGVILALGLAGMLLSCVPIAGWVLGGIALSMANTDLPRMDRGYMDRDGRGLTVGGQVCAIIAVIINSIVALIVCSGLPEAIK
jgi:lysine biosynthesis protein LysW